MRTRLFLFFILIWTSLVQLSCESGEKNSVLVIAIDNLGFNDINCLKEDPNTHSGLKILCDEAIRYTHAFSTSTMSGPNIASMLTGLYPYQHGVRHNGTPALSPALMTASKKAIENGYRTSFFSGGAPIFRKTGLAQGFEVFEDRVLPSESALFKPFTKTEKLFETWLKNEVGSQTFFTFLYLPDLSFVSTEGQVNSGEIKNITYENQIEEVDAALYQLFSFLKKENRWNNTTLILTGLSGLNTVPREHQIQPLNLHGENTQVAFFVKPHHKPRDAEMQWKVDRNINLADLGLTLFSLVGQKIDRSQDTAFPLYSLQESFKKAQPNWPEDRWMLIESGWPQWHGWGGFRSAIIAGHELYIHDEKPLLYNTLTDRLEQTPVNLIGVNGEKQIKYAEALKKVGYEKWLKPNRAYLDMPDGITAQIALNNQNWKELLRLGNKTKNLEWIYVANKNLGLPNSTTKNPCLLLLITKTVDPLQIRLCEDPLFIDFYNWLNADTLRYKKDQAKRKFEQSWQFHNLDVAVMKTNFALGRIWDIPENRERGPILTDLALALPEFQKLKQRIAHDLSYIEQTHDD